jgi:outer membrane protein OmpA-like peptidoglycan-associated protein
MLALFFSMSCMTYPPLKKYNQDVRILLEQGKDNRWVIECAGDELAIASSNYEFAKTEEKQGDVLRAGTHYEVALSSAQKAIKKGERCRPMDSDNDGLSDIDDDCPNQPELINGFKDEDGCPEQDSDGDGVFDEIDKCLKKAEDFDDFEDEDGCPEQDNDQDGFADANDACPNDAEDYDADRDEDGCPEETKDRDGDGIEDALDNCPRKPESKNGYLDEDGCPDKAPTAIRITSTQIEIKQKILFETGSNVILEESYFILEEVGQALRDYPKLKINIEGHTDSIGSSTYNKKLSQKRAESVKDFLVEREEISSSRLSARGFGEGRPLSDNDSEEGREQNRRVEFNIIQQELEMQDSEESQPE